MKRGRATRWLAIVLAVILIDAVLPPAWQPSSKVAIGLINVYQVIGRPVTRRFTRCPYSPSCSEYGEQAFAKYGFWPGLSKTIGRLSRCRGNVRVGTVDEP